MSIRRPLEDTMGIRQAGKQPDESRAVEPVAAGSSINFDLEEALMLGILASAIVTPKARRKRRKNSPIRGSS
jgi:hypothetical protein